MAWFLSEPLKNTQSGVKNKRKNILLTVCAGVAAAAAEIKKQNKQQRTFL